MKATLLLLTLSITVMIGYRTLGGEKLVTENGQVAAKNLPIDLETSKIAYKTATFGMG